AHLSRGAHPEAFEDLDRGRLSGAVGAEQGEHLAPVGPEGHPLEHVRRPVAHPQVADVEHGVVGGVGRLGGGDGTGGRRHTPSPYCCLPVFIDSTSTTYGQSSAT